MESGSVGTDTRKGNGLALTLKVGDELWVGEDVIVTYVDGRGGSYIKVAVLAPREVAIGRSGGHYTREAHLEFCKLKRASR